jgi:membrane protease YdiL (CAAX protease family)
MLLEENLDFLYQKSLNDNYNLQNIKKGRKMESKINNLSICYTLFLIFLLLSGALSGAVSEAVQYIAYILPFLLGLYFMKGENTEKENYLLLRRDHLKFVIPIVFPTVAMVVVLSIVTSALVNFISGVENNVDVGDSLIPALVAHALIPAVFEELLFRYIPIRMLKNHSGGLIILVSSAFFALIHHSLFSIPYAFAAGLIFMTVDLVCESVIPSFILHFINNAISVGLLVYRDNQYFLPLICGGLVILSLISLVYIVLKRKYFIEKIAPLFGSSEKVTLTPPAIAFGVVCLVIAIISII